jgi:hypothetical protein
VDLGSFNTRLFEMYFAVVSFREFLDTPSFDGVFVHGYCITPCEYTRSFLYYFRNRDFVCDFISLTYVTFLFHDVTTVIYVVCLKSSVNGTRKQTEQKIQKN